MPGVFDGVNGPAEIDIVRELGYATAKKRLTAHRSTFITERDFVWIKHQGFDFVRLPVGYWLFEQTNDFVDGEIYLKKAFRWAKKHDLMIILDFHGAQGSQNGKDHSGQVGKARMLRGDNQRQALATLRYIARTYGHEPALLGLEVINEPRVRWFVWPLLKYYDRAYDAVAPHLGPQVKIIISDAFRPLKLAQKLSKRPYGSKLVLDIHLYQVFSWRDRLRLFRKHVDIAEESWWDLLHAVQRHMPVIVGEWSAALPSEAYRDGAGDEASRASEYYMAQKRTFDDGAWAHAYWTYKAPGCGVWSWRDSQEILED